MPEASTDDLYRCPYPGCGWQPSRPVDSENRLTQAVVHREVEKHREEHTETGRGEEVDDRAE